MLVFLCATILVIFLIQNHLLIRKKLKNNFPPGPLRLPLLGCAPFVSGQLMHLQMEGWRERFGNLVGLLVGPMVIVTVRGVEEVQALLRHEHCQARPDDFFSNHRSNDKRLGIFVTDGKYWSDQRRFTMRELRDLGFGKASMEGVVMDEVLATMQRIQDEGPLVKPNDLFKVPMLNVMWWLVCGKPFAREGVPVERLCRAMHSLMHSRKANAMPFNVWPFLRYIAPEQSGYNGIIPPLFELVQFVKEEVESKIKLDDEYDNSFISVYLREAGKRGEGFSVESLIMTCFDLFTAGGESTGNQLSFALMYLAMHPEAQAKAHEELDAVVGRGKPPVLSDRIKLPYLEAVLAEVMRINPIAPITAPHVTTADIDLNGYTIPKDTICILSVYSVLNDKKVWGDPENFRPDRFLDAEGRFVRNPLNIPFGMGKRGCMGEALVHQTLFLFLGALLSRFRFSVPPGCPPPSTIPTPGFTVMPQPYQALAEMRA